MAAPQRTGVPFKRFGGLRLDQPIDEVSQDEAILFEDSDWGDQGTGNLRQREGAVKVGGEGGAVLYRGAFPHSESRMILTQGKETMTKVIAVDTKVAVKAELAVEFSNHISFAQLGTPSASYTYLAGKNRAPIRFDGTTFTEPTATVDEVAAKAMPVAGFIAVWPDGGNRLVAACTGKTGGPGKAESSDSRVWFSDAGNAESWHTVAPEANYVQLAPGDGETITAVCHWNGMIFVFKESKLFVFYSVSTNEEGAPVFNFKTVELGTRMVNPSIWGDQGHSQQVAIAAPDGVYFLAEGGVFVTNGTAIANVSTQLAPLAGERAIVGPMGGESPPGIKLEEFRWNKLRGLTYFKERLYLNGGKVVLVYDIRRNAWLPWSAALLCLAPWQGTSRSFLYFTGSAEAALHHYSPTTAADSTVTSTPRWQSGFYDLGTDDEKTLVETKIRGSWAAASVTFSSYKDASTEAGFSDKVTIEGTQGRSRSSHTGTLFSHRLEVKGLNGYVSRIVRYLREDREPTTKTSTK